MLLNGIFAGGFQFCCGCGAFQKACGGGAGGNGAPQFPEGSVPGGAGIDGISENNILLENSFECINCV